MYTICSCKVKRFLYLPTFRWKPKLCNFFKSPLSTHQHYVQPTRCASTFCTHSTLCNVVVLYTINVACVNISLCALIFGSILTLTFASDVDVWSNRLCVDRSFTSFHQIWDQNDNNILYTIIMRKSVLNTTVHKFSWRFLSKVLDFFILTLKGIVSRDFRGLQMILIDRTLGLGISLEVYFFLIFSFCILSFKIWDLRGLSFYTYQKLTVRLQIFLLPGAHYFSPQIRFKTPTVILVVELASLSKTLAADFWSGGRSLPAGYNVHLLAPIELAGSIEPGNAFTCRRFFNWSLLGLLYLHGEGKWSAA